MKYIGLKTDKSLVNREDAEKLFGKIRERVKAHRRKIREDILPDLEELSFMNATFKLVNGNIQVASSVTVNPSVYLLEGTYKIVVTARKLDVKKKGNIVIRINRSTTPSSNTIAINEPLTDELQTFEHSFTVDKMGNYKINYSTAQSVGNVEIKEYRLVRVYQ